MHLGIRESDLYVPHPETSESQSGDLFSGFAACVGTTRPWSCDHLDSGEPAGERKPRGRFRTWSMRRTLWGSVSNDLRVIPQAPAVCAVGRETTTPVDNPVDNLGSPWSVSLADPVDNPTTKLGGSFLPDPNMLWF